MMFIRSKFGLNKNINSENIKRLLTQGKFKNILMETVFLTNLAAVAGKYERYDVLSAILDFETHNRLPLKKLRLLKNLKENPA